MLTSDGTDVGFNPDSTTSHRICYTWQADQEGVFLFSDMADTRSGEDGTNVHGLFGAIIVEAAAYLVFPLGTVQGPVRVFN